MHRFPNQKVPLFSVLMAAIAFTSLSAAATEDIISQNERTKAKNGNTGEERLLSPEPELLVSATDKVETKELVQPAEEASSGPASYGVMAIPALNYNQDNGFGFGLVGKAYRYHESIEPYQIAVKVQIYMTTKLLQDHELEIDILDLFSLPLRLTGRLGFYSSASQNFCGYGNAITCDEEEATNAARVGGHTDPGSQTQFEKRYYLTRFIRPYGILNFRWKLRDMPHRVELMGGWRGFYYMSGELFDRDGDGAPDLHPYPGSLYEKYHRKGEDGLASLFQFGIMLDHRDSESAPKQGYWIEASVRGSAFLWGSAWDYAGYNLTARTYMPLMKNKKLVNLIFVWH